MAAYDYVILGCGVSGMYSAKWLTERGIKNILVLDHFPEPGGNQISHEVNGFTFDIGAFYYWPTMPLFRMFPEMLEDCPRVAIRTGRIQPSGKVGKFPFSVRDEFLAHGPLYWLAALASMGLGRLRSKQFETAEDFAVHWMGRKLYVDLGMAHYIKRFFGIPAHMIEVQFAISRMQSVTRAGKLNFWLRNIYRRASNVFGPAPVRSREVLVVRPVGGLAYMYRKAVRALLADGVDIRLGESIEGITPRVSGFAIEMSQGTVETANLVSTIPVKQACGLLGISAGDDLECVDLVTLFISFEGARGFHDCILYNWGVRGRWKRLTMHSDYYGARHGREYASVEVPLFRDKAPSAEALFEDFCDSVQGYGLFRGDIRLEGYVRVGNAYPAYTLGTSGTVSQCIAALKELGVQSAGRQGRFDYLPSGEQVAQQVANSLEIKPRK